jgi:hypothetical protein
MLAILRPDSWNLPLFLHVLGATVVTGATAAVFVTAVSEPRWPWLRVVVARALLLAALPAWILMRLGGAWEDSRSTIGDGSGWLGIGYLVADAGFVLLIVASIFAAVGVRRPERAWPLRAVAIITGIYFIALVVAMVAMTGKPGS